MADETYQLIASHISKSFIYEDKRCDVLRDISFNLMQGETCALVGASGVGKSTLLHVLAGVEQSDKGTVSICSVGALSDAVEGPEQCLLRKRLGILFQSPFLVKELTVLENVMIKGLIAGKSRKESAPEALDLLHQVGISDKADVLPSYLSGGQQQRVALARALFGRPVFLLLDEPTGDLDDETSTLVIDFVMKCSREWNMGVFMNTHDKKVMQRMKHIFELKERRLVRLA
ncbi:MAG: ATP-binding cassette domain-containing protein [Candidatus Babeliales bacterium]